jgi:hypothetical protein
MKIGEIERIGERELAPAWQPDPARREPAPPPQPESEPAPRVDEPEEVPAR